MTRLSRLFERLKQEERSGFAAFITACDPDYERSVAVAKKILDAGADLLEVGMPFSDPMAEGAAIQASSQRALSSGAKMEQVFALVRALRETHAQAPIILMGYYNPLLAYGLEAWARDASSAGADGVIIVDAPPEEDEALRTASHAHGLVVVRLVAPTSEKRFSVLLKAAEGFLYYVSITGTTGAARPNFSEVEERLARLRQEIKKHKMELPIALGFGIKTAEDSANAARVADLVVVGSALVELIAQGGDVEAFVKEHVEAIGRVKKR